MRTIIILTVALPIIAGVLLPVLKLRNRRLKLAFVIAALAAEFALVLVMAAEGCADFTVWKLTKTLLVSFRADGITKMFTIFTSAIWLFVGLYSCVYMKHEQSEDRFFAFYLLSESMLIGMDVAGNLFTLYMFYEGLTLMALPLVLHTLKKEAISAAVKYLFYSIGGAFLALFGILVISHYAVTLEFIPGGSLDMAKIVGHEKLILIAVFVAMVGFGTKAGMYPMHGWLPAAHPVAPAPASAVLSAVIAKGGVLAIIRILYYNVGADFIAGTWVQKALLSLALLTIFMGSMMAYRTKVLKTRLAYSTVSQISYVLLGVFLLSAEGLMAGLLHTIFHATIKTVLFLSTGIVIYYTGRTHVDNMRGIGKETPIALWSFTIASIALIGIPPASGFISKWALAMTSIGSGLAVFSWLAPVILLISALLTAGYLLPISIAGFFPGKDYIPPAPRIRPEKDPLMWAPVLVVAILTIALGIWSSDLVSWLTEVARLSM